MGLIIKTTGLEQYAPGGQARLKLLIIGGPGTGKTRFSSTFPKPIFADCEAGLASVADRRVPYVSVNSSTDMLDLLTYLKQECRQPRERRKYETVVIDTLDAYQRKLKYEWMELNRKESFIGWEAWGYLNQKMGLLLTRLLNLDMNVVVNVHYKDKTTKDDDTGKETHELMLQLQGESADTAFNDFDLVGWMGTYWEPVGGERVHKRGLTFTPTPDKPFLKDRLHVTQRWAEITFEPSDYENLFAAIAVRLKELEPSSTVGEIPRALPEVPAQVVTPEQATSGPLVEAVPVAARGALTSMDKPSLAKLARELGIVALADGSPIKGNTLKAELVAAIGAHQDAAAARPTAPVDAPHAPEPAEPAPAEPVPAELAAGPAPVEPAPTPARPVASSAGKVERVAEGLVNRATGELIEPSVEQAVASVTAVLGGQVVAATADPKPTAAPVMTGKVCEVCGEALADSDDYVKLAWIKYRAHLCRTHYIERKQRGR